MTHLSEESGQVSTQIAQDPRRNNFRQETRPTASDSLSIDSSEEDKSVKTNESQHFDMDDTSETHQHNTPDEESKPEDIQRTIKIRCYKVQSKILFMKKYARQRITQSERDNKFRKCILDTYNDQYDIVAEADDLIIEYYPRIEAIIDLFIIDGDKNNQYCRMQKRHLRQLPDDTLTIEKELLECISEF